MKDDTKFRKAPVPAYMMSYGDMMTLLLTFFILLVSMAREQQAGFVAAGKKSFIQALNSGGLPGLLPSGKKPVSLKAHRSFFAPSKEALESLSVQLAKPDTRILDPIESKLRRDFVVELAKGREVAWPTKVAFTPHTLRLTRESRDSLNEVIRVAQIGGGHLLIEAHVAQREAPSAKESFAISGRRAQVVADYLHRTGGIPRERMTAIGYGCFRPLVRASQNGGSNERINVIFTKPPRVRQKEPDHG